MATTIEFWFDFSSPCAYFASLELEQRLGRFTDTIRWRPYLMGVAFQKTGMQSLSRSPMRGDYARHDWQRIAGWKDVPFTLRDDHPFPSQNLARTYYWFVDRGSTEAVGFAKGAFHRYFGEGRPLRSKEDVLSLAAQYACDTEPLIDWLKSDSARHMLRERTTEALDKGVFGSPFFLAGKEPFWGWDRMAMLEEWLERQSR